MNFYELVAVGKFEADFAEGTDWEGIKCPINNKGHQRAGKRIGRLRIDLPSSNIPHFITTFLSDWIITNEVAKLFKKAGFTGYELKPVTVAKIHKYYKEKDIVLRNAHPVLLEKVIRDRKPKPVPKLWELLVRGWGGMAPPESGIKLIESCEGCGHLVYSTFKDASKLIDVSKWDGSDFFMVWPLPRFIFVTERVADLIKKNKLKGVKLIPVVQLSDEDNSLGKLSPGRLSRWMPEKRAHLLGDPLGIF
jgi:hypothetical protein